MAFNLMSIFIGGPPYPIKANTRTIATPIRHWENSPFITLPDFVSEEKSPSPNYIRVNRIEKEIKKGWNDIFSSLTTTEYINETKGDEQ